MNITNTIKEDTESIHIRVHGKRLEVYNKRLQVKKCFVHMQVTLAASS